MYEDGDEADESLTVTEWRFKGAHADVDCVHRIHHGDDEMASDGMASDGMVSNDVGKVDVDGAMDDDEGAGAGIVSGVRRSKTSGDDACVQKTADR